MATSRTKRDLAMATGNAAGSNGKAAAPQVAEFRRLKNSPFALEEAPARTLDGFSASDNLGQRMAVNEFVAARASRREPV